MIVKNTQNKEGMVVIGLYVLIMSVVLIYQFGLSDILWVLFIDLLGASFLFLAYGMSCWDVILTKSTLEFQNNWLHKRDVYFYTDIEKIEIRYVRGGPYFIVNTKIMESKKSYSSVGKLGTKRIAGMLIEKSVNLYLKKDKLFSVEQLPN